MTQYCTYLTIYSGKLLPPFYIGSTSIANINSGYRGSVTSKVYKGIWKSELKTHPELFKVKILSTFKTREEAGLKELKLQQHLRVHNNPLYINMGYFYGGHLLYSRSKEAYKQVTEKRKGYKHTEETRRKISESNRGQKRSEKTRALFSDGRRKGKKCNSYGKPVSQETRDKIRIAQKGVPCPQRGRTGRTGPRKGEITSIETRHKICKYYWMIANTKGVYERVDLFSDWCKEKGLRVDCAGPAFRRSGKYREFLGYRVKKES